MLNIFLGKKPEGLIDFNDGWFDMNTDSIDFSNKEIRKIIKNIDGVEYADDLRFFSKFKKNVQVDITELSTGCKTAINIYSFPDKIFNLAECGNNALEIIFNFKQGNGYVQYYIHPRNINNKVNVVIPGKKVVINSDKQLHEIVKYIFREENQ